MTKPTLASRAAGKGANRTGKAAPDKPRKQQTRGRSIDTATKKSETAADDALAKKIIEIKQFVIGADEQDVAARYKIAVGCKAIRAGEGQSKTYGAGAAKKLGKALGWSKSTVYAHAAVADAWNQEKFNELAAKRDKRDKPLSWTHIMILATEKDAKRRRTFATQTVANGWSIRELKKKLSGDPGDSETTEAEWPKPPRPLVNAVENYTTNLTTAKANAGVYGETIGEQIEHAKAEDKSKLLARLKQARMDLEDHYQTESKRLDAMIQTIESGEQAGNKSVDDSTVDARPVRRTRK
jgi:hypothetical protein